MDSIRESYDAFCALCDPALLDTLRERVEDMHQEWQRIMERLKNKIADLKVIKKNYLFLIIHYWLSPFHNTLRTLLL